MRAQASILHLDLDAFFAAVEQRDKPSLRGKPVIVGGIGTRGVVSTASYEARAYGARSAMPTSEARRRCPPGTAYLSPRFEAYRASSHVVMDLLHALSPVVEQVSVDEAYVDLAAPGHHDLSVDGVRHLVADLIDEIASATGGLTASAGVASSKMLAKIGSELEKPHGLVVIEAGRELEVLEPLSVRVLGGVGPATAERLKSFGVATVADLQRMSLPDLVSLFGDSHGHGLHRLARAQDDRDVVVERETKSISAEETFDVDVPDRSRLDAELSGMATRVVGRLGQNALFARTVTIKIRHHDFSTHTRSATLAHATGEHAVVLDTARRLLADVDVSDGLRLLGVGVSGFTAHAQTQLAFDDEAGMAVTGEVLVAEEPTQSSVADLTDAPTVVATAEWPTAATTWRTGQDVRHDVHGAGWVWGAGIGRVSVRFEGPRTQPGAVRTFTADDAELHATDPPDWRAPEAD
ncbi:DNA polymerase IV [Luteipulveratus mongoliensis]|uniref:DNA polymerase IV n=1 Tax=Luteipulveratus mongoliensis TaxID=571913 RepID=A0A0K1JJZ2_9MICO|nr:DNA polymerase IV [Luteipulveratus mongoliensis]AKU17037.1 DNA repair nucleotidyltransferase [Luteipulveratus mongoliensis]